MKPTGKGKRSILFVGKAPGTKEDREGKHFIGKPGALLRDELKKLRRPLEDCKKTNAAICHPPKDQLKDVHIECCRPNLLKTIREFKPSVIILLGSAAVKALIPTDREGATGGIKKWVGWTIPSHEHQAWICPTYHPSFLIKMDDPVLSLLFRQHLKKAITLEKTPIPHHESLAEMKKKVELIMSPRLARLKLKDLSKKEGLLAFDYENTGLKPEHPKMRIVSVSFCYEGEDTFAFMMHPSIKGALSRVLKDPSLKKVASNLKYEERWTRNKLGHGVAGWDWDTMIAAHILDNRKGIASVKFQAYIHFGIANYDIEVSDLLHRDDGQGFNQIDKVPPRDLLLYNGLDSLLEFKVMEKQKELMNV